MFEDQRTEYGVGVSPILGTSTPDDVCRALLRAVRRDLPEVFVNPGPTRLMFALALLFPRLNEWVAHRIGAHVTFRGVAAARGRGPDTTD